LPYSSYLKNKLLDTLRNQSFAITTTYASLHSGAPGDSGANEIAGGSPAYARKSITWNAAAAGSLDSSNAPVFDVPASTTVAHVGFFDAATSGNFLGSADVTDEVFAAQGTYTLTDADLDLNS
jgi:hypothetical protein